VSLCSRGDNCELVAQPQAFDDAFPFRLRGVETRGKTSVARIPAELSTTSTTCRASRISQLKYGSAKAKTSSDKKNNCTNNDSRCRRCCQMDRGCFSSKICRQNRIVETGTRRSRIFRM
jgi:hypothetical protein